MTDKINRMIHGDSVKALGRIDENSVDLVFADPPFNIGYDYDEYDDKRSAGDYLDWTRKWMSAVKRVLTPEGAFWLAIGDDYAAELKVMATRELGFTCRNWVIWYYTFGVHCKYKFTRSHTHLLYFVMHPKKFTFNADDIRVPSARQLVYGDKRANAKGRVPDDTWIMSPEEEGTKGLSDGGTEGERDKGTEGPRDEVGVAQDNGSRGGRKPQRAGQKAGGAGANAGLLVDQRWILRPQDLPEGFSADSDTWYFPRVCGTFKERKGFHGCQMPEQILGRIIKSCSSEGDTVLDPFSGSGTTVAVAKKLKRNYLGIDLSKQYVDEARARLDRIKPGDPLDGFENPLTSAPNTSSGTIRTADGKRVKPDGTPRRVVGRKRDGAAQAELFA